jgi:hypothetical protein
MALNFPSNPNSGDTYTEASTTWQYDGVAWNVAPSAGGVFPNTFGTIVADGISLTANTSSDAFRIESGTSISISKNIENNTLTINADAITPEQVGFYIAGDDSTQRLLSSGETIKFIGGTGIDTSTDIEGNVTINSVISNDTFSSLSDSLTANLTINDFYESAIATLRVNNNGTTSYTISSHYGGTNPSIYAISGTTIAFDLDQIPGHPFEIQNPLGDPYNDGLVHVANNGTVSTGANAQGKDSGTLFWRIPESISGGYRYQCHAAMVGSITIKRISLL